ncbi:MAG: Chromosome-partitioning protein Spo0J [candidate division WS2 bacterium]|nr:Chromosome-partitioning protein Spo0J [Candidatus Lithacetigena glycinireducens]
MTTILPLSQIKDTQPRREHGDISDLKESIKRLGLLHPLVVTPEYSLVAGRRRYQALVELGIKDAPVYIVNPKDGYIRFLMALDENLKRKDMSWQEVALAELEEKRIYEECYPQSKKGQAQALAMHIKEGHNVSVKNTLTYTAAKSKALGVSEEKIQKELQLARAIEQYPRIQKAKTKREAFAILSNLKKKAIRPTSPEGKYDCIVIDPPWPVQKIERDCRPNQTKEPDYPTMSIEEIKALEIPAGKHCHLWLWTTHKYLPAAFSILESWGFRYICCFVWHKPGGFQPIGLPQYNCEFVLYGRRGKPEFVDTKAFFTCFSGERVRHSQKPDSFYEMVKRVTSGKRLDMFSRRKIEGFEGWGNEAVADR